ncbi:MAG: 16S rRNA (guanine(966)-N(2))-methyltransferase RsmD [Bacteroidales bacterium]
MRIISGEHRGRRINPPKGLPVRPTTDMAREGLFNILQNLIQFENIRVLDLFSGTGAVSFEFLSRRAAEVVAVDQHPACYRFISSFGRDLGYNNLKVFRMDWKTFLRRNNDRKWDIIFADPPYDIKAGKEIHEAVFNGQYLAPDGLLIIEHEGDEQLDDLPGFFQHRKYSRVHFTFFRTASGPGLAQV